MKKIALSVLIFFSFSSMIIAQEDIRKERELQVGVNATYFISNFLGLNQNELVIGPYAFIAKFKSSKNALRLGIGGRASNTLLNNDFASNIFERKVQVVDLRFGIEREKVLSDRWAFYFGLDGLFGTHLSQTLATSSFDEVLSKTTNLYAGGGPILGFEFTINPKISLSTESSVYIRSITEIVKNSFRNFPEQNNSETTFKLEFETAIPTELFFVIHF